MPTPRGDAPLTKHLAVPYGPDMARAWQALPYLVLPGAGVFDHLYDRQRDLKAARPVVCPRPGRGRDPRTRVTRWVRKVLWDDAW